MESNTSPNSNRPSRAGNLNPMWGRHQSDSARRKQSEAARRRAEQYKKALNNQDHITMDEFLSQNPKVEQYIKTLVREQINIFLWKDRQPISIPIQWD